MSTPGAWCFSTNTDTEKLNVTFSRNELGWLRLSGEKHEICAIETKWVKSQCFTGIYYKRVRYDLSWYLRETN